MRYLPSGADGDATQRNATTGVRVAPPTTQRATDGVNSKVITPGHMTRCFHLQTAIITHHTHPHCPPVAIAMPTCVCCR